MQSKQGSKKKKNGECSVMCGSTWKIKNKKMINWKTKGCKNGYKFFGENEHGDGSCSWEIDNWGRSIQYHERERKRAETKQTKKKNIRAKDQDEKKKKTRIQSQRHLTTGTGTAKKLPTTTQLITNAIIAEFTTISH